MVKITKNKSAKNADSKDFEVDEEQLKDRLYEMEVMIKKLEWDESRNQINPAKKVYLDDLRKEFKELCEKFGFED